MITNSKTGENQIIKSNQLLSMEQNKTLTIEQAAKKYAELNHIYPTTIAAENAFQEGAEWQKEQDKMDFKKALEQIRQMGKIIRLLDENSDYSEFWLLDGNGWEDYVPGTDYLEKK